MRKLFTITILLTLIPALCLSSPFLIADPSPDGAEVWQAEVNGALSAIFVGDAVHYDLIDIPPGDHTIRARYGKAWTGEGDIVYEWSEWSAPFPLARPEEPAAPIGQKIEP